MATVSFDFDSTLITCESLDELLARVLAGRPAEIAQVREITNAGMEGRISFRESVERRLAIAKPSRDEVESFGREAVGLLTEGIASLVAGLDAEIWIVSGALREVLLPTADHLGVPAERVVGTRAAWDADGRLDHMAECPNKVEALADVAPGWSRPRIVVGDGMSDHALVGAGLADHFIAFTQNVRREPVVATGAPEAESVRDLEYLLDRLL